MEFYMPTRVISEKNCVQNHSAILREFGRKAMVVTGKHSSRANGSLADLEQALKKEQISYLIFDEIEENPSIETVMKARQIGLDEKVEFVIGLGGGSPMDAAKAIALMIANPQCGDEVLYQKIALNYLPVIEIPTTAGTGSEVTPWSILTIHAKRTKSSISHSIYPSVALVDGTYLRSMSRHTLVSTAVDTLAHLVESYLVSKATPYTRTFSEKGLRLWGNFKDTLAKDNLDDPDYEDMMMACTMGGIAITHTGTGLPHALGYKLTYELGTSHGIACGYTLAGFLAGYEGPEKQEVLNAVGFADADAFTAYLNNLIGPAEIPEKLWQEDVEALMNNPKKMATYPMEICREKVEGYLLK